jgi:hypothetical protein
METSPSQVPPGCTVLKADVPESLATTVVEVLRQEKLPAAMQGSVSQPDWGRVGAKLQDVLVRESDLSRASDVVGFLLDDAS